MGAGSAAQSAMRLLVAESAARARAASRARWPDLPCQRIRGMRNVLYHTGLLDALELAHAV